MIIINRASFIAYTQGVLMDFKDGTGVVGDNINHERAEEALNNGETVGLSVGGKLFSTIALDKEAGEFREQEICNPTPES